VKAPESIPSRAPAFGTFPSFGSLISLPVSVSSDAVFVALGGSGYAAVAITLA
jgi:hypothetical protein